MAEATPTSPWQPTTSAPEMEALCFDQEAHGRGREQPLANLGLERAHVPLEHEDDGRDHPGGPPQVGAVTTQWPAAFSSDAAKA